MSMSEWGQSLEITSGGAKRSDCPSDPQEVHLLSEVVGVVVVTQTGAPGSLKGL